MLSALSTAEECMPRYIVTYDSIKIIQRPARLAQGGFSVLAEEYSRCESISRSA
ncbi:hypothetical protein OTSANNIE_0895 [Anaplasma phagocytophilum str. Annie]|uniref:Uncharacterized protein n=1 Tax=Anaplasma phagocytophilum str. NCH-1 TaxID=1359161 RepID=A0A0F3NED7_ANAPH|nr:hypothetical protein YYU_03025 [Anaplasma phagocytophilum str. HZ2]AGR80655.1 hypothetical protein WSQ_03025 [Anaplasma phagocytophilum str. JM]AGR81912.1 hypothetical protein YYY_03035 [Anaplasma phagocytophilum str. Dog2]KJV59766.1 hypothetical protein APHWEB_1387 [Anaplasma phagocytophilum str. Webster]KJV65284.1 hypothetical protein EPHNCH_0933 [Anaplasma phagocytophilum str. NCH-1]KJV83042.1 hypothetical protein APHHGE2_0923 [Anaplasma phagocytophilum str. HGE2]KJV98649.1 hypothetical